MTFGEAPTVGRDTVASGSNRILSLRFLGRIERHIAERLWVGDAELPPSRPGARPSSCGSGRSMKKRSKFLTLKMIGTTCVRTRVARSARLLCPSHEEIVDVQQEARLRPKPGDAVHVQVAAVLAEQVGQVDDGQSGEPRPAVPQTNRPPACSPPASDQCHSPSPLPRPAQLDRAFLVGGACVTGSVRRMVTFA